METNKTPDYWNVVRTVHDWPSELRLSLAETLLQSLHRELPRNGPCAVPVEKVLGMAAGQQPVPDDATVKRWLEEHRLEKYG